jgi:hypothetical protein
MENKATGVLIICNPAQAYMGLSEKEVADKYHELAFTDYDALVKFASSYDPEKADVRRVAMWKKGKALQQTVFAEQPIVRIGDSAIACISSSYLFNPGRLVDGERSSSFGQLLAEPRRCRLDKNRTERRDRALECARKVFRTKN